MRSSTGRVLVPARTSEHSQGREDAATLVSLDLRFACRRFRCLLSSSEEDEEEEDSVEEEDESEDEEEELETESESESESTEKPQTRTIV